MTQSVPYSNASSGRLLPEGLLVDGETLLLALKPSLWMIPLLIWPWLLVGWAITAALALWGPALQHPATPWIVAIWVAVVLRTVLALLQWAGLTCVLTDRRIIRLRGVFHIDIIQCDLTHIQHSYLSLSLTQRLLRLGSIAFATAGTGLVEVTWPWLRCPLEVNRMVNEALARNGRPPGPSSL